MRGLYDWKIIHDTLACEPRTCSTYYSNMLFLPLHWSNSRAFCLFQESASYCTNGWLIILKSNKRAQKEWTQIWYTSQCNSCILFLKGYVAFDHTWGRMHPTLCHPNRFKESVQMFLFNPALHKILVCSTTSWPHPSTSRTSSTSILLKSFLLPLHAVSSQCLSEVVSLTVLGTECPSVPDWAISKSFGNVPFSESTNSDS